MNLKRGGNNNTKGGDEGGLLLQGSILQRHSRGQKTSLLASPGQGGDQRRTCSAPTYGSQCKKVISACSRMLLPVGTTAPAQLLSAHAQAPSSPSLPQEMPKLWAASAMHLQHQPARAERSIPATTVVKSWQVSHTGSYLPVPPL